MHIKFIPLESDKARLANVRLALVKYAGCEAPDDFMDMIFHRGHGEVWGFKLRNPYGYETEVFTASKAKVDEESKACGHKTEDEKRAWLDGIKKAEARVWQSWLDGEVYGLEIQRWDEAKRFFTTSDCRYPLFGWDDVVENLKDMDLHNVDVFCVDADCGDPNKWKDEFREFDI